jgi:hypothetical protein
VLAISIRGYVQTGRWVQPSSCVVVAGNVSCGDEATGLARGDPSLFGIVSCGDEATGLARGDPSLFGNVSCGDKATGLACGDPSLLNLWQPASISHRPMTALL